MTPWDELIFRTLISVAGVTIGSTMYVRGAYRLRKIFQGGMSDVIHSTYAIICSVVLVSAPFIYLIMTAQGMVLGDDGWLFLGATAAVWLVAMAVMLLVIFYQKKKLNLIVYDNEKT